jgi:hypothetical protein
MILFKNSWRRLFLPFLVLLISVWAGKATAREMAACQLFADTGLLKITLEFPIDSVIKDNCENPSYFQGTLKYQDAGDVREMKVQIRKRGKFRCNPRNCTFPPLWVKFGKKHSRGTLFDGQDKLKMVNVCNMRRTANQDYILKEYLVYRFFNQLTDSSFRVRLLRVTYKNSQKTGDSLTRFAFFIENEEDMAARINGKVYNATNVHPEETERSFMNLVDVFQYMAGNTDYSVTEPHNIKIVGTDPFRPPLAVPYDFDWCGLVDAPYAVPNTDIGIENVRQRAYMGFCRTDPELQATLNRFRNSREGIMEVINGFPYLNDREKQRMIKYLASFFKTIENTRFVNSEFHLRCKTRK